MRLMLVFKRRSENVEIGWIVVVIGWIVVVIGWNVVVGAITGVGETIGVTVGDIVGWIVVVIGWIVVNG